MLHPRRAQARQAELVDRLLPGQEFLDRQRITIAGFFQRQQTAANGRDDFRLAPGSPSIDAGTADGAPADVMASDVVQEAYMGRGLEGALGHE